MRKLVLGWVMAGMLALPATGSAATITFSSGTGEFTLDHRRAYTWAKKEVSLGGDEVVGATLHFENIRNWDSSANTLFIWLADTAKKDSGVASHPDDPSQTDVISDYFAGSGTHLISGSTGKVKLTEVSFGARATDWDFALSQTQVAILASYISNGGDFAFAFDPDCHYYNGGFSLSLDTVPPRVPEPATMGLVVLGLAGLAGRCLRRAR